MRAGYNPVWIPLTPTEVQWQFLEGEEWWQGDWAGVGKTTVLLMAVLRDATNPRYRGVIFAPTHQRLMCPGGLVETMVFWVGRELQWQRGRVFRFKHGAEITFEVVHRAIFPYRHFVGLDGASWVDPDMRSRMKEIARSTDGIPARFRMVG